MREAEEDEERLALHLRIGERLPVLIHHAKRPADKGRRGAGTCAVPRWHHPQHGNGDHHEAGDKEGQPEDWCAKPHVWSLPLAADLVWPEARRQTR
jgi:hypothetical protein